MFLNSMFVDKIFAKYFFKETKINVKIKAHLIYVLYIK